MCDCRHWKEKDTKAPRTLIKTHIDRKKTSVKKIWHEDQNSYMCTSLICWMCSECMMPNTCGTSDDINTLIYAVSWLMMLLLSKNRQLISKGAHEGFLQCCGERGTTDKNDVPVAKTLPCLFSCYLWASGIDTELVHWFQWASRSLICPLTHQLI